MKYYEVDFTIDVMQELFCDARDVLSAMAGEAGFETFEETEKGLLGYVQQALFRQEVLDEMLQAFPFEEAHIEYKVREAEDRDWNEQWEQEGFQPIVVGETCVIHDGRHTEGICTENFPVNVEIDARLAFGTGTHETTRMMVARLLELDLRGKRVLDCGCGTGILGIVALKRGASEAVGYDIDEWSVDNARHNAVINRVEERFVSRLGDVSVLQDIAGEFDVILANINRNILLADMEHFRRKMADGGILLLSGFYGEDTPLLTRRAEELGWRCFAENKDGEWACLSFRLGCA